MIGSVVSKLLRIEPDVPPEPDLGKRTCWRCEVGWRGEPWCWVCGTDVRYQPAGDGL